MNRLNHSLCYLCGPMDRIDDGGVVWRRDITPVLKDLGIGVLDPTDKPTTDSTKEDGDFREYIERHKALSNFDLVKNEMKRIAGEDLRMIDIAHFVVMYMDIDVHMCGSYHEAFTAIQQKKPLLVVCEQGASNVPNWLFGVMPHEHMFSGWNSLISYIRMVDNGRIASSLDNRWRFFDFDKIYSMKNPENVIHD